MNMCTFLSFFLIFCVWRKVSCPGVLHRRDDAATVLCLTVGTVAGGRRRQAAGGGGLLSAGVVFGAVHPVELSLPIKSVGYCRRME